VTQVISSEANDADQVRLKAVACILLVRFLLHFMKLPFLALLNRTTDDRVFLQDRVRSVGNQDASTKRISDVATADRSSRIKERNRIIPGRDEPTVLDKVARGRRIIGLTNLWPSFGRCQTRHLTIDGWSTVGHTVHELNLLKPTSKHASGLVSPFDRLKEKIRSSHEPIRLPIKLLVSCAMFGLDANQVALRIVCHLFFLLQLQFPPLAADVPGARPWNLVIVILDHLRVGLTVSIAAQEASLLAEWIEDHLRRGKAGVDIKDHFPRSGFNNQSLADGVVLAGHVHVSKGHALDIASIQSMLVVGKYQDCCIDSLPLKNQPALRPGFDST
jgi:hypothetical protein